MARVTLIQGTPGPDDDRPGFLIHTPYDEAFKDELKQSLPWADRRWVPHESAWWCAEDHEDLVVELAMRHFTAVEIVDEDGVITTRSPGGTSRQERFI